MLGELMLTLLLLVACGTPDLDVRPWPASPAADDTGTPTTDSDPGTTDTDTDTDPETDPPEDALYGWIGSPCDTAADCPYDGAVCLTDGEGYPNGTCSIGCDAYCDDSTGYPTTACVDAAELPAAPGDGACLSRCDSSLYPATGCREGYGCVPVERADRSLTDVYACIPGAKMDIGACREDLLARGVGFEANLREDSHPSDDSSLTCHVEEPVYLLSPVAGVDLRYYYDDDPKKVLVDCETAHAIADTAEDIGPLGVAELVHVGTYNCRTISGSSSLSQHALGRAIDINGFTFDSGENITVLDHWEDGDSTPESWEGQFLYEAVHRWYDDWIWNIILTPEYNSDHDNHFHVDMAEGYHSLHFTDGPYLGVTRWPGE